MNELDNIIANLVNSLVKDEWEAVDGYNSAITTLSGYDDEKAKKVIKVLEDIRDEEYVHIGQLESCLSMTDGDPTEDIDEGSEEGFEQLELPEDEDVESEYDEEDDLEVESLNEMKIKATGNMVEIPIEDAHKSSLSEKEMKKIICTMIDKYDASEEETFDEIQASDPTITRETVHRLYKMCSKRNESLEPEKKSSFDEMWGELDKMEDNQ